MPHFDKWLEIPHFFRSARRQEDRAMYSSKNELRKYSKPTSF